jgi:hypothetical protein
VDPNYRARTESPHCTIFFIAMAAPPVQRRVNISHGDIA